MITIDLSQSAESRLRAHADAMGIPAEAYARELLESVLTTPATNENGPSALEALAGYIGAIDSSTMHPGARYRSACGDIVEEKLEKQGIVLPKR